MKDKISFFDTFFLVLGVFLTSFLIGFNAEYTAVLNIIWSMIAVMTLLSVVTFFSSKQEDIVSNDTKVGNLLKGLHRKKENHIQLIYNSGFKSILLLLIGISGFSACYLFIDRGIEALPDISILTLCTLIFWVTQNNSIIPEKASVIGTFMALIFSAQIALFHALEPNTNFSISGSFENSLWLSFSGLMAGVFIIGLFTKNVNYLFPIIGLFILSFALFTFQDLQIFTYPIISCLLAACFAQSSPTAEPENFVSSANKNIYT